MVTLHGYILRELLKTFGLTLTALTVLFTMGGGLFNVVHYEGVSAGDVFGFIHLLIPIAATVTMPIAAVFAAAMVYGRLAADNELLACRAAGINIHRTFMSALLLSIFVAIFTFLFANFLIPGLAREIEDFVRKNLRDFAAQQLEGKGFIQQGKHGQDRHTLTAERVQGVSENALREKGFEVDDNLHYLLVTNPTYMHQSTSGELLRFAAARFGLVIFDTRDTPVELTLLVRDGSDFDVGQRRAFHVEEQQIGPADVPPLPRASRLSIAPLSDLLRWRTAPWGVPDVRGKIEEYRNALTAYEFHTYCHRQLASGGVLVLPADADREYRVSCQSVEQRGKGVVLAGGRVEVIDPDPSHSVIYEAERVELSAVALAADNVLIEIKLVRTPDQPVLEYRPRAGQLEPRKKTTVNIDGAQAPAAILAALAQYSPAAILDPQAELSLPRGFEETRLGLGKLAARWQRKIVATIHFRFGFISSVLVTVMMGAALGVIFRGARVLAAVALSLIPFFSVGILMVLGSNLTKEAATTQIGPLVTWGGLVLVLLADVLILRLGVRR